MPEGTGEAAASQHGPLMRFARHVARPATPTGATLHRATLRPIEVRSADDYRHVVVGITAQLRIADPAQFERAYRADADKMERAVDRIQVGFAEELRRAVSRITRSEFAAFDPYVLLDEGTRLRRLLDQIGLAIDDLTGDDMGYRSILR